MSVPHDAVLDQALLLVAAGFAVLPVHRSVGGICSCRKGAECKHAGKHPDTVHGVKDASRERDRIQRFNRWGNRNVAIATGLISNVVVIDIDPRHGGNESLAKLEAELGKLPTTVTVETGGGGRHYYFRCWDELSRNRTGIRPGIDFRGDNGYVVAPPSLHASGSEYCWQAGRSLNDVAIADLPPQWRQLIVGKEIDLVPALQRDRVTEKPKQSISPWIDLETLDVTTQRSIQRAIEATLPTGPGERNHCIFRLCKLLKGLEPLATVNPFSLGPIVEAWYERARPNLSGNHAMADCLDDFVTGWRQVRFAGDTNLQQIMESVSRLDPHPACAALGIRDRPRQLLVGLCWELQQRHGDAPFFLACRIAAKLLSTATGESISHVTCNKMLNALCVAGVLEVVHEGTTRRATRYRFIWAEGAAVVARKPSWLPAKIA